MANRNQPVNKNMLSGLGFTFNLKRSPGVNFFCSSVNVPGLSGNAPQVATPFKPIFRAYDKLEYNELQVTFKVDEDMGNFLEIFDWMVGVGFPADFEQRRSLESPQQAGLFSDGQVVIQTSKRNTNLELNFVDLLPVSLSDLQLTSQNQDVDYLECTVSFRYTYYTIRRI
ncbi:tail tube protein [Stenotrophomonas phage vB_SmaS-DLP_6]|nr:tail tube protein [Stenotrophomonas phage vB_SmaS-DLP_6]